jgi:uncharacterized protein
MEKFDTQEVEWNVDKVKVYGTLVRPKDQLVNPAVVFVAGSGPTDRDWCSPLLPGKNGSGKLLAEALSSQGFITLRYDKLASGPHAQENVTKMIGRISMQSHVDELSGAVKILGKQKNTEKGNLFVLTNSEGAIHALNYQLQAKMKFKGLVLTSTPGRPIGEVARNQIINQIALVPDKETIIKHYDEAIASFLKGNPITPDPGLPETIKQLLLSLDNPANLPFARELWNYNPSEAISKVKEPSLVVISKKDIQVDWRADGKVLEAADAGDSVSFVYPENADHVLKYEETPRAKLGPETALRYNASERKLDQEAAKTILSWLKKQS